MQNTFLVGDYNIDLRKSSPEKQLPINQANSLGLKVDSPSCGTRDEAKLDFLVSPKKSVNTCMVYGMNDSDHDAVVWELNEVQAIDHKRINIVNKRLSDEV